VAVLGGTAAFENVLTGQTFTDCDGTAEDVTVGTQLVIAPGDSHSLHLNVADGWAASGDAGAVVSGQIVIQWRYMGEG
jgi:D-lyxose ketol-isomerase